MGGKPRAFETLIDFLEDAIIKFPDTREGRNCQYSLRDAGLSAFSVFHTQSPSFLDFQNKMEKIKHDNNARTLFRTHKIPTNQQIANLLDPVAPDHCFPVFQDVHEFLDKGGVWKEYHSAVLDTYFLALDGTWFHSSEKIHCSHCSVKRHRNGETVYYHSAITPVFIYPGHKRVISAEPEFITPQDGEKKQDCEINSVKRWVKGTGRKYAEWGVTLLGDDIFAHQPLCREVMAIGYHYLFTCKPLSHKYLYEWVNLGEDGRDVFSVRTTRWTGKKRICETYRFMNNVPIKEGADAIRTNWCELVISDKNGKVRNRFAFVTDHVITKMNVMDIVAAGRGRWKIENEHNNTLKTKGYNLEHNFSHGKENLSNLLLTLNVLAFFFHTVLEIFDSQYARLRKWLGRRKSLFEHLRVVLLYFYFKSWDEMLQFMICKLKIPDLPDGH